MEQYAETRSEHMEFLVKALDGEIEDYQPPDLAPLPEVAEYDTVQRAAVLVRGWGFELRPRYRWEWPKPEFIPDHLLAQFGETLCGLYSDERGKMVRRGFGASRHLNELLQVSAWCIRKWGILRHVSWVTSVPSAVQPESERTRDFARSLANTLDLPFVTALEYQWTQDIGRRLKSSEMYLEFLVTAPEDPDLVIWRDELKQKMKCDRDKLFQADRVVVRCRPEQEHTAKSFLKSLAKKNAWVGPMTVWRFDSPEQTGNIAVMMFPGKREVPWHTSLNSLGQAINFSKGLRALEEYVVPGPVLLVNDLLEYGWSFAYAAARLREAGCQKVFPFALARSGKW